MSLILDALRKADAERERGAVPGLHTQPAVAPSLDTAHPGRQAPWLWALGAAALLAAAAALWLHAGRPQPAATTADPPAAVAATGPEAAATAPPAAAPMAPIAEPAPWPQPEERKPAAADATGAPPVYAPDGLPPQLRSQLPALSFGGSIYSANARARSLIINGQLFREGDEIAPELLLEQIKEKSAVLRLRSERFELRF